MIDAFVTVICGVAIFVLGQLFMELLLKPLQRYKKMKAKLSYLLVKYYSQIVNVTRASNISVGIKDTFLEMANQRAVNGREEIKEIAAELEGFLCEKWTLINFMFAKPKKVEKTVKLLLNISKRMITENNKVEKSNIDNKRDLEEVIKCMKLYKKINIYDGI